MCIFCPVPQHADADFIFTCDNCVLKPRFQTLEMLEEHIAVQHFRFSPYQCRECPLFFGTEHATVTHVRHFHGRQQFSFIFHYTPGCDDIRTKIKILSRKGQKSIVLASPPPSQMPPLTLPTPPSVMKPLAPLPQPPTVSGPELINSSTDVFVKPELEEDHPGLVIDEEKSKSTCSQQSEPDVKPDISMLTELNNATPNATVTCTAIVTESTSVPNSNTAASTPNMSAPKIGPIDFAEFGHDSILHNDDTLAELMKRSDDLNRQEDDRKRVECKQCGMMICDQRSSRFYHANTRHIKLPLYECLGCGKKWCTISRSDVVKHVQANHQGDESLIIDHKTRVRQQLKVLVELCFPKVKKEPAQQGAYTFDETEDFEEDEVRAAAVPLGRKPPVIKHEDLDEGELTDDDDAPPTLKKIRSLSGHTPRSLDIFKNC